MTPGIVTCTIIPTIHFIMAPAYILVDLEDLDSIITTIHPISAIVITMITILHTHTAGDTIALTIMAPIIPDTMVIMMDTGEITTITTITTATEHIMDTGLPVQLCHLMAQPVVMPEHLLESLM